MPPIMGDRYVADFTSGDLDPESTILEVRG